MEQIQLVSASVSSLSHSRQRESMEMKCEFLNECEARAMLARAVSLTTVCSYSVPAIDGLQGQSWRLCSQYSIVILYVYRGVVYFRTLSLFQIT
jgi:hypothetical protein